MEQLRRRLQAIDGKSYKAYKQLEDRYRFPDYTLSFDHVQGDPFALPSRLSLRVPMARAAYPPELWSTPVRRIALEDYLGRAVARAIAQVVRGNRGTGKSGAIAIACGGQQVLPRNAIVLTPDAVEARITLGLPADKRTVLAGEAREMLFGELPAVVKGGLLYTHLPAEAIAAHVRSVEDQDALRQWLAQNRLVAFVADGAVLPRLSGIDDRALASGALRFRAPDTLAWTPRLPNAGPVRGMGIPEGVTLIVGGGFHGKSTLLHALERGVYNHVLGDGRERVATEATAVKIRAEDGRALSHVDISAFIDRLPLGRDTRCFSSENASGSTSQAANIIEAMQCGTRVLLVDEDTSATNFMIRDERMQALVTQDKEPITPFLHRVRALYEQRGISSIIVMGGSGDYFEVADTIIMMDTYEPRDVTDAAHRLAGATLGEFPSTDLLPLTGASKRRPDPKTLSAARGRYDAKIDAKTLTSLFYGEHSIDLSKVEQIVEIGQTRAIGWLIHDYVRHALEAKEGLAQGLEKVFHEVSDRGLDSLTPYKVGDLAMPRLHEVAAAINRMRDTRWEFASRA